VRLDFSLLSEVGKEENNERPENQSVVSSQRLEFTPNLKSNKSQFTRARKESIDTCEETPILERLKGYECSIEHVYNSSTKRMNKIITCNYDSCGKQFTKTWNILDHFKVHTGEKPYE